MDRMLILLILLLGVNLTLGNEEVDSPDPSGGEDPAPPSGGEDPAPPSGGEVPLSPELQEMVSRLRKVFPSIPLARVLNCSAAQDSIDHYMNIIYLGINHKTRSIAGEARRLAAKLMDDSVLVNLHEHVVEYCVAQEVARRFHRGQRMPHCLKTCASLRDPERGCLVEDQKNKEVQEPLTRGFSAQGDADGVDLDGLCLLEVTEQLCPRVASDTPQPNADSDLRCNPDLEIEFQNDLVACAEAVDRARLAEMESLAECYAALEDERCQDETAGDETNSKIVCTGVTCPEEDDKAAMCDLVSEFMLENACPRQQQDGCQGDGEVPGDEPEQPPNEESGSPVNHGWRRTRDLTEVRENKINRREGPRRSLARRTVA